MNDARAQGWVDDSHPEPVTCTWADVLKQKDRADALQSRLEAYETRLKAADLLAEAVGKASDGGKKQPRLWSMAVPGHLWNAVAFATDEYRRLRELSSPEGV